MMAIKKLKLSLSSTKGSVLVIVTIFVLIFAVLALLTMRAAVLQNANKLREFNVSRTFYAADGTVEQAAWIMSWITRGDATTANEYNRVTAIPAGRRQPRFPLEANETIIGVTNGGQSQLLDGGQRIFGDINLAATPRDIPFDMAASFDNQALIVPTWFPMVSAAFYRYDLQDVQLPEVMVRCRVEREDLINRSPSAIDGYLAPVTILNNGTLLEGISGTENGNIFVVFTGIIDGVWGLYISVPFANPLAGQRDNFANLVRNLPRRLVTEARYYVIIAEAEAPDSMSPNFPFRNVAKFHYAVISSRRRQNAEINGNTVANFFIDAGANQNVPGHGVIPGNRLLRFNDVGANALYGASEIDSVFRSRR